MVLLFLRKNAQMCEEALTLPLIIHDSDNIIRDSEYDFPVLSYYDLPKPFFNITF
jgi:hypothetical protein